MAKKKTFEEELRNMAALRKAFCLFAEYFTAKAESWDAEEAFKKWTNTREGKAAINSIDI